MGPGPMVEKYEMGEKEGRVEDNRGEIDTNGIILQEYKQERRGRPKRMMEKREIT